MSLLNEPRLLLLCAAGKRGGGNGRRAESGDDANNQRVACDQRRRRHHHRRNHLLAVCCAARRIVLAATFSRAGGQLGTTSNSVRRLVSFRFASRLAEAFVLRARQFNVFKRRDESNSNARRAARQLELRRPAGRPTRSEQRRKAARGNQAPLRLLRRRRRRCSCCAPRAEFELETGQRPLAKTLTAGARRIMARLPNGTKRQLRRNHRKQTIAVRPADELSHAQKSRAPRRATQSYPPASCDRFQGTRFSGRASSMNSPPANKARRRRNSPRNCQLPARQLDRSRNWSR